MVNIKGTGLSGLSAAISLAKKEEVTIHEKRKTVGSFFNVDVHSFKNYGFSSDFSKYLEMLGIEISYLPIYKTVMVAPNNSYFKIVSKKPLFLNIVRGNRSDSLDSLFFNKAIERGVKINFNANPPDEYQINASGAQRPDITGYGYHFSDTNIEEEYIIQDNNFAPQGYVYLSPYLNNEASLMIVSYNKNFDIKKAFEKLLPSNDLIKEKIKGAKKISEIHGFASYNVPKSAIKDGRMFVGEAAGFMDAGRGFGMYYAIVSGCLAAKAINEGLNYDKLWKEAFGRELFERFARRQYFNMLSNEDHNRIIEKTIQEYGTEIPLEVYQNRKDAPWYKELLLSAYARYKLIGWRKTHKFD